MRKPHISKLLESEQQFLDDVQELINDEERLRLMSESESGSPCFVHPAVGNEGQGKKLEEEDFGDHEPDDAVDASDTEDEEYQAEEEDVKKSGE